MARDEKYMAIALKLAKRREGFTSPNPMVGAVVVKGTKVVGSGYHKRCGLPHAEVNALKKAGRKARGATLYATLEPCGHYGRTPPCTDVIIKSGVKRVVAAMKDPNPINNGRGIKKLKSCGIKTSVGILEKEANSLNRAYIKFITSKMPYVTVKVAESLDGKIATRTGDSKWITAEDSRLYVHRLRAKVDAVMVGANTVTKDDPLLLSKAAGVRQPIRIVVDSSLKTPRNSKIVSSARKSPVMIAVTHSASNRKIKSFNSKGVNVLKVAGNKRRVDLKQLFRMLGALDITNILVEGGGELIAGLVENGLVDRFLFFIAPKIIGGSLAVTAVEGSGIAKVNDAILLKNLNITKFTKDILIEAEVL